MNKLQQSRIFLIAAILLIVAFQAYWLNKLYHEENIRLQKETGTIFRDVVYNLQVEKFKQDTMFYRQSSGPNLFMYNTVNALRRERGQFDKKILPPDQPDSVGPAKPRIIVINRFDTQFHKAPAGIEIRRMLSDKNIDTALLKRMAGSGVNVIVKYNNKGNDSINGLPKEVVREIKKIPQVPAPPQRGKDTAGRKFTATVNLDRFTAEKEGIIRLITSGKALDDTIATGKMDSAYTKELSKAGIPLAFQIKKIKDDSTRRGKDSTYGIGFRTPPVPVGFSHSYWYQAEFGSSTMFILKKISPQILFSFFLVAFTSLAFMFLYRNLVAQRKLTEIKNDFIGNVTHELKTPIATVNVAIEALRNFGGLDNPERTKEYLDISASELQRLSLLVDKVLKLSMFEKQEIALQKESFDLLQLVEEVVSSMKLQFEKQKAKLTIENVGDNFMIDADRLHITSVIYNLLDNALKYSKENPQVGVKLIRHEQYFELRVTDNGIGIADAYRSKIFDQFFRVPSGNRHNTKGYGLGLSYVNYIIQRHQGFIEVESELGKGSTFIVKLPFAEKNSIHADKARVIRKTKFKLG